MAGFITALRTRLQADPELFEMLGGRFFPVTVTQGTPQPYARYNIVSDTRPEDLDGYVTARSTRLQVDVFAPRYEQAHAIAERIIAVLDAPAIIDGVKFGRIKADGPRDLSDERIGANSDAQGFTYRVSMDLLIRHQS